MGPTPSPRSNQHGWPKHFGSKFGSSREVLHVRRVVASQSLKPVRLCRRLHGAREMPDVAEVPPRGNATPIL